MLACDWDEKKLIFPYIMQPKVDGVRALNLVNGLTGRSLKKHRNEHTTKLYSHPDFVGFDGELAAERDTHPDLCRLTASAVSTKVGEPYTQWHLFDYLSAAVVHLPYYDRLQALASRLSYLKQTNEIAWRHLGVVEWYIVNDRNELEHWRDNFRDRGYEGAILRGFQGKYKEGRCTIKENLLLRIKDFQDAEAVVVSYEEGQTNTNEAQINELGKTFRTSHQERMVGNGQVGTIIARKVGTDEVFLCSPGNMSHDERIIQWMARSAAPGKLFTYKHFPHGVKDKPRFPTWKFWRDSTDMSE